MVKICVRSLVAVLLANVSKKDCKAEMAFFPFSLSITSFKYVSEDNMLLVNFSSTQFNNAANLAYSSFFPSISYPLSNKKAVRI